jgi:S1-C subfamily serine protease
MHPMPASFLPFFLLAPALDGWLGIFLAERDEAVVAEVIPGSPAAMAGLAPGDVLLAVGDTKTATHDAFIEAVRGRKAGDRVAIRLRRDGRERTITVQLGERPDELPAPGASGGGGTAGERPQAPAPHGEARARVPVPRGYLGLGVRDGDSGVVVDRVVAEGPAAAAGVRVGEVVVGIDGRRVDALSDLDGALRTAPAGRSVALLLRNEEGTRSVTITLGTHPDAGPVGSVAPVEPVPEPPAGGARQRTHDTEHLEAELAALRAELAELRRQIDALRRAKGRE